MEIEWYAAENTPEKEKKNAVQNWPEPELKACRRQDDGTSAQYQITNRLRWIFYREIQFICAK